jgi:hypothetical protein
MSDSAFISQEIDRFQDLIQRAGQKWGRGNEVAAQVIIEKNYVNVLLLMREEWL